MLKGLNAKCAKETQSDAVSLPNCAAETFVDEFICGSLLLALQFSAVIFFLK